MKTLLLLSLFLLTPAQDDGVQEFLTKIDGQMFNLSQAGVHTLTLKLKMGNNPMIPAQAREMLKDMEVVYYWRESPWNEAVDVIGLPPEMERMKGAMKQGPGSLRKIVPHALSKMAPKFYKVTRQEDGEHIKMTFVPFKADSGFDKMTVWYSVEGKLLKMEQIEPESGEKVGIEFTLTEFRKKWLVASLKQTGGAGQGVVEYAYDKSGDVPLLTKMTIKAGPVTMEVPVTMILNPAHDASIFPEKKN